MAVLLFFQCLFSLNKVAATRSIVLVCSIQSKTHRKQSWNNWRVSLFTVRTTQVLFLIFHFILLSWFESTNYSATKVLVLYFMFHCGGSFRTPHLCMFPLLCVFLPETVPAGQKKVLFVLLVSVH